MTLVTKKEFKTLKKTGKYIGKKVLILKPRLKPTKKYPLMADKTKHKQRRVMINGIKVLVEKKKQRRDNSKEWSKYSKTYKKLTGDRYHANKVTKEVRKILKKKRK